MLKYWEFQQVTFDFIVFEHYTNCHLVGHNHCCICFHIYQSYNPSCSSTVLLFAAEYPWEAGCSEVRFEVVIIDQFYSYSIQVNLHVFSATSFVLRSLKYTLGSGIFTRQVQCYLLSSNFILSSLFFHYQWMFISCSFIRKYLYLNEINEWRNTTCHFL